MDKVTKDNWIKAFCAEYLCDDGCLIGAPCKHCVSKAKRIYEYHQSQIKDAIEKRTKLLEESFKHRTKPVINLDDEDKNCDICGYDHEYMVEDNENAYKVAHLKFELSQAIEKTNKRWVSLINRKKKSIQDTADGVWDVKEEQEEAKLKLDVLSDLLEDKESV